MRFRFVAISGLLLGAVTAQVPDGHYVVSSFYFAQQGVGGLSIVHPRLPGPPIAVTGLGADLTGVVNGSIAGANCVAVLADGTLLVGEVAGTGATLDVHRVTLAGVSVATDVPIPVGVVANNALGSGQISQIAWIDGTLAAFATGGLVNQAPLNGNPIGLVDLASGLVQPLVSPTLVGRDLNALAYDRASGELYVAAQVGSSASYEIFRVPLAGGAAVLVTNLMSVSGLAVAADGTLLASANANQVIAIDPVTGTPTLVATVGNNVNGLGLERATGNPVAVLNNITGSGLFWITGGAPSLLTAAISGVPSGIAVVDSPRGYGSPTSSGIDYEFALEPTPGGLPIAGNSAFAIQDQASSAAGQPGLLVANFAPASTPLFGVQVLIDPVAPIVIGLFPAGIAVPFPIPAGFAPLRIYLQSFHLGTASAPGLAATAGMLLGTIR
ncbi:MAG: hypothetical protein KDE27_13230 [Planctomycetes bacterium]|nr:hypothetical protein [Planctomycetota bacterium]